MTETAAIIKLALIFAAIVALVALKRPLYQAMLGGIAATALLYRINPAQSARLVWDVAASWGSMSVLFILYAVTFLQKMLERRSQISLARQKLDSLFNNRRVNASIAPLFIGLLPSAAAMILCGDIVKEAGDGYLDRRELAFVTSWFRHVPESILPTYPGVILMCALSGVPVASFLAGMAVPALFLIGIGYFLCLRKIPKDTGRQKSTAPLMDSLRLVGHLWSLFMIVVLILALGFSTPAAILTVIALAIVVYRFRPAELMAVLREAVEVRMLISTFLVLVFKEFTDYTRIISYLPDFFMQLPIPLYLVFSLLFFFGAVISGSSGIIALGTTMTFQSIPGAGMPLMVLLMGMCHAASQISPAHVCLAVATEYYQISMWELVKKTLPAIAIFCVLMVGYYHLLLLL